MDNGPGNVLPDQGGNMNDNIGMDEDNQNQPNEINPEQTMDGISSSSHDLDGGGGPGTTGGETGGASMMMMNNDPNLMNNTNPQDPSAAQRYPGSRGVEVNDALQYLDKVSTLVKIRRIVLIPIVVSNKRGH